MKQRGSRYEREYCWDNFLSANTLQVSQAYCKCHAELYTDGFENKTLGCPLLQLEFNLCLSNLAFIFQMLHNMKGQFAEHLMNAGFVSSKNPKDPNSNVNSGNRDELFKCSSTMWQEKSQAVELC